MLVNAIKAELGEAISQAYTITIKQDRYNRLRAARPGRGPVRRRGRGQVPGFRGQDVFGLLEYRTVRENIVNGKPRIDGRDTRTVRPLRIEVGVLGKTHGSALFTRGETQALVVATLGTARAMPSCWIPWKASARTPSCCTTTPALRRVRPHGQPGSS